MLERLGKEVLFFDGAMGTQLHLKVGEIPEQLNIDEKERVIAVHEKYLLAGCDFITTNTFGCNRLKMEKVPYCVEEMICAAVENVKEAKRRSGREDAYIVLDIGPIGQLMEPMGTLTFDEAYEIVAQQVSAAKDEVDAVLFETMSDLYEVKAGILAVKENSDLPVFVSMTFEKSGRTLSGTDPITFVNVVEGLGVDMLGVNCSLGPNELHEIMDEILSSTSLPVLFQPNAGLPCLECGETKYHVSSEEFALYMMEYLAKGVAVAGGCCGTTPSFIETMKKQANKYVVARNVEKKTRVSSASKTVTFGEGIVVCGERLNPTGKKKMQQALFTGNYEELLSEAFRQQQAGAHILDVNVGVPGIDETTIMKEVICALQQVITLPLQIDTSSIETMEKACRYYNGKPLINSVNGKEEVMEAVFPIVKKYGGVVIGLTLDDAIPSTAEKRVAIAQRIIDRALSHGIDPQDVIIDALVLTASAKQQEVQETLKTVAMVKKMGHYCALGVSNVSFGLPKRSLLNRTFLTLALGAGLDLPIINPLDEEMMDAIAAFEVLHCYDLEAKNFIGKFQGNIMIKQEKKEFDLQTVIYSGMKEEVEMKTREMLTTYQPLQLVDEVIIPALHQVGEDYEKGILFLPQLMQAAETCKLAFQVVQENFPKERKRKGPILMATVQGDIHDIGKNIVKVVMESYGYEVIDLGKDIAVEVIVDAYHHYQPKVIGLSALMTTTLKNMELTISELRKIKGMCPILVGGAVLSEKVAEEINADYYAEDAMASIRILETIIK